MNNSRCLSLACAVTVLAAAVLPGCGGGGPATGFVEGTVTLDGKPLEGAMLRFQPANGRGSIGSTDENGHYVLRFTATDDGAIPGQHKVLITTQQTQSGGEGGEPLVEARPEMLPPRYHIESELTANVEPGTNEVNFELTSE